MRSRRRPRRVGHPANRPPAHRVRRAVEHRPRHSERPHTTRRGDPGREAAPGSRASCYGSAACSCAQSAAATTCSTDAPITSAGVTTTEARARTVHASESPTSSAKGSPPWSWISSAPPRSSARRILQWTISRSSSAPRPRLRPQSQRHSPRSTSARPKCASSPKAGKLPQPVFKSWIAEFAKEREALNRPAAPNALRVSRSEFLQAYRSAAERKLKIFTSRENVALAREALRTVLAEGRLILRPDVANTRFEGSLVLSHEEFFEQKQIDIKLVAWARL